MNFTRRQWMGASAVGLLGALETGTRLSPLAQAMAATSPAAAPLESLASFTGQVTHATH